MPLVSQLDTERDNIAYGPWNGCTGSFSSIFHHLRCLGIDKHDSSRKDARSPGFKLSRVTRCFQTATRTARIAEKRISIAVLARYRNIHDQKPICRRYNGLLLVSPGSEELEDQPLSLYEVIRKQLESFEGPLTPVFGFLALYFAALNMWYSNWMNFIGAVEALLHDEVSWTTIVVMIREGRVLTFSGHLFAGRPQQALQGLDKQQSLL